MAEPVKLEDLPEDEALYALQQIFGGDEQDARMALAIAKGEIPVEGDVVQTGRRGWSRGGKERQKARERPRWKMRRKKA